MSRPLVSIIIPSYNSKVYLNDAVYSALNQSYKPVEVIIVDDGSTDGTSDLFPKFKEKQVKCFSIENGGASYARNYGLGKATGDYIQFLDADDVLTTSKIEKQLALMQTHKADLCYCPWVNFKQDIRTAQKQFKYPHIDHTKIRTGKELLISYGMENWTIITISWLVNKKLIEKAGLWDHTIIMNNDGEYFSRVLFLAEKVVCCNEVLAYYRLTPNSLSKLNSSKKIDSAFKSIQKIEILMLSSNDIKLLSYPKRLYFMQYKLSRKYYPDLAKRAAHHFDRLKTPSFLSEKVYYWKFVNWFGLYNGTKFYKFLQPIWRKLKNN